jgi:NAD(P)-dependent dehydrogenase (short-subunit alcohol dehydrogenase family)
MLLSHKVAIITGGARGIGKGIALKFAEEGCSIVIADILVIEARKTLEKISEKGREAIFVQCDVSNSHQVQDMVDQTIRKFGKVDILVNNAGIGAGIKSISDISEEEWDKLLGINLKGVFLCCKAVVPHMKGRRYGKIINLSSCAAIAPPAPLIHYSSAKAGILGLTLDLALELAPFNICVNAILPGLIPTPMWDELKIFPPGVNKEDLFVEMGKTLAPMQRVGTPEDIAGAAIFLASDLSAYVTGDRIIVAGGYPLKQVLK